MGVQGLKDRVRGYVEVVEAHSGRLAIRSEGDILDIHLAEALWLENGGDSLASHIACIATTLYMFAISCIYSIHLHSLILSFIMTRLLVFSIRHDISARHVARV